MIQDIAPKKFYNQFAAKKPSANSRILSFSDGKILYKEKDGEMEFLTFKQVGDRCKTFEGFHAGK